MVLGLQQLNRLNIEAEMAVREISGQPLECIAADDALAVTLGGYHSKAAVSTMALRAPGSLLPRLGIFRRHHRLDQLREVLALGDRFVVNESELGHDPQTGAPGQRPA